VMALVGGIAGTGAGYYSGNYQVNGRNYNYSGYSSTVGSMVSSANVSSAMRAGEINVAALEANMLMDNTILPGEIYGGLFEFDAGKPLMPNTPVRYTVTIPVGTETHQLNLAVRREKVQ